MTWECAFRYDQLVAIWRKQVQLDFSKLKGIIDDMDFCAKLVKEESVILLPGKDLPAITII